MPEAASPGGGLRLRAEDAEDLEVISACLQDALVAVGDLAYDLESQIFVLVANRFRWEARSDPEAQDPPLERTLCGVAFDRVTGVVYRGFERGEEDRILALLAIRLAPGSTGMIDLEFSGGATIRLTASAIGCRVRDLGEPWPTQWQPGHALDESA